MRNLIFGICSLLCYFNSFAQDSALNSIQNVRQLLFRKSHFAFNLMPLINEKATVNWESGPYHMGATSNFGGEFGFDFRYHLNTLYSITIGIHGTATVRNFTFFVPKEDFTPNLGYDFEETGQLSREADFYLSMPILAERRWFTKNNSHWNIAAGARICYYPTDFGEGTGYAVGDSNGQYYTAMNMDLVVTNNYKPWLEFTAGGGYNWVLSNHNLLRLNLMANYSNIHLAKGSYQIMVPGKPVSNGTYESNHSYIGLSVSYAFTGTNKRLLREYEAKEGHR